MLWCLSSHQHVSGDIREVRYLYERVGGRVASRRVGSSRVETGRVGSGRAWSDQVGSGRVGSGRVRSGRVRSGPVRSFLGLSSVVFFCFFLFFFVFFRLSRFAFFSSFVCAFLSPVCAFSRFPYARIFLISGCLSLDRAPFLMRRF